MSDINELKFDKKNFNKHTKDGMALLGESLQKFGAGRSVLVDKDNNIIAGNGIVEAAQKAGITKTKVIETTGDELVVVKRKDVELDSDQGREMALADNATGSADLAWDEDLLKENFGRDILDKWNVGLDWEPEAVEEDEAPEVDVTSVKSEFGKVYKLGEHRLMCGDSTDVNDVSTLMGGQKANMVFADPPYNVAMKRSGTIKNDNLDEQEYKNLLANAVAASNQFCDGNNYWWIGWKEYPTLANIMLANDMPITNCIVWVKPSIGLGKTGYRYRHELCIFSGEIESKSKSDVWEFERDSSPEHPTMKPVRLVANAILDSTRERERVLDLFGGSGTTMMACEQLGRKCYMMELDPHYCDVIRKRWWKLTHDTEDGWEEGTPSL